MWCLKNKQKKKTKEKTWSNKYLLSFLFVGSTSRIGEQMMLCCVVLHGCNYIL